MKISRKKLKAKLDQFEKQIIDICDDMGEDDISAVEWTMLNARRLKVIGKIDLLHDLINGH